MVSQPLMLSLLLARVLMVGLAPAALAQWSVAEQWMSPAPANRYTPPPCTGTMFADVTCSTSFDASIEQLRRDGITAGCGNGDYGPSCNVTRAQLAVFVENAVHGTASWTPANVTSDLARMAVLNWWGGPYSGGSYGFDGPSGVVFDGTHVWVANFSGTSVTEVQAR